MINFQVDCQVYNTKDKILNFFMDNLEEMYSPNYDALIDGLSFEEGTIEIKNISYYEDEIELKQIIDIVSNINNKLQIK